MTNEDLKNCPFCGGKAKGSIGQDDDGCEFYEVECVECGLERSGYGDDFDAWQTRPAPNPVTHHKTKDGVHYITYQEGEKWVAQTLGTRDICVQSDDRDQIEDKLCKMIAADKVIAPNQSHEALEAKEYFENFAECMEDEGLDCDDNARHYRAAIQALTDTVQGSQTPPVCSNSGKEVNKHEALECRPDDPMPEIPDTGGADVGKDTIIAFGRWLYRNHGSVVKALTDTVTDDDLIHDNNQLQKINDDLAEEVMQLTDDVAVLPVDVLEQLNNMGAVEWGATKEKTDKEHIADFTNTLKLTREAFDLPKKNRLHGLYIKGTETLLCLIGISPNSPANASILTGLWNKALEQTGASDDIIR